MKQPSCLFNTLGKILIFSIFLFGMSLPLNAEVISDETRIKAIKIAQKIRDEQLLLPAESTKRTNSLDAQNPKKDLEQLRDSFLSQVWSSKKEVIQETIDAYNTLAQQYGTNTDKEIGRLLITFLEQYDDTFTDDVFSNARAAIDPYFESQDWFIRHQAYNLASLSYPGDTNLGVSLETAQDGLKQIPQGTGPYIFEAKAASISSLSYLHSLLLNLENSVDSYAEQIELKLSSGKPIDGMSIINNFIYVFRAWKDNETAKELVDILLYLEETHPNSAAGLTEVHASRIHAGLGNFEPALKYAEKTLSVCEIETICNMARFAKIVALAGLGRVNEAKQAINALQINLPSDDWRNLTSATNVYEIEALLAAAEGDASSAVKFMNKRTEANIQQILSQNSGQTANLLASLQNSKERRQERAAALETESELKQIALSRQQFINRLLIALSIVLLSLVIAATAFARYRSKIATRMEVAAKKAVAGEKSKAEFLAIMSHELRTPLNGILGVADIMARKSTTPDVKKKMNIIADCGQDLLELVENIFDMTLIESGDIHLYPERVNIYNILADLTQKWSPRIEEKNIVFTSHIGTEVPEYMELDRDRFTKSIDALLSNAHKFTKEGRVHLHVSSNSSGSSELSELKVIVADTGVGISDEAQTRLFKPFVQADSSMTRHFGGAGLGLAIAQGLSQLMDGHITVNSRSQRGSEFTLTINAPALEAPPKNVTVKTVQKQRLQPKAPSKPSSTPAPKQESQMLPAQPITSLQGLRILVAEDDLGNQAVLQTLLEPSGAKLIFTINGLEALEALSLNHYDLIITDIRMPTMDGFTFVEQVRENPAPHRDIPIIALTADVATETSLRCKAAGVDIVLMKPVKSKSLYDAIAHVRKKQDQDLKPLSRPASKSA